MNYVENETVALIDWVNLVDFGDFGDISDLLICIFERCESIGVKN